MNEEQVVLVVLVVDYYKPHQGKFELLRLPGAPLTDCTLVPLAGRVADLSRYYCGKEGKQGLPLRPTLTTPKSKCYGEPRRVRYPSHVCEAPKT